MSCCSNKPNGCRQGRDCELNQKIAEQRLAKLNRWLLDNYLLVSNSWMIVLFVVFLCLWVSK